MVKNKFFWVIFFVFLVLIFYFYTDENIEGLKEEKKRIVKLDISEERNKSGANFENHNHEIVQNKCSMKDNKKLIPDTDLKSIKEINLSVDELLGKNNSNISAIVKSARQRRG